MELINYGTMELWIYEIMELWNYEIIELRNKGTTVWNYGHMEL
jgi:hypothetical protein